MRNVCSLAIDVFLGRLQPLNILLIWIISLCLPVIAQDDFSPVYKLTPVHEPGENTITHYEWNNAAQTFTPHYYRLDLSQTTFGKGENVRYYEWITDEKGEIVLSHVDSPSSERVTISLLYDEFKNHQYNAVSDENISANFMDIKGDYQKDASAIRVSTSIGDIDGNFVNNNSPYIIFNNGGNIKNIKGLFIGNHGHVIDNYYGNIDNIEVNFIGNTVIDDGYYGLGIENNGKASIESIKGNFVGNNLNTLINNYVDDAHRLPLGDNYIGSISANFISNSVYSIIENSEWSMIGSISGDFINNKADAALIYNAGVINDISGNFKNNSGCAILNGGTIGNIINSSFIGNKQQVNLEDYGELVPSGAILTYSGLNIIADNGVSIFSDNEIAAGDKIYNGGLLYIGGLSDSSNTFNLISRNNGVILFNDRICGVGVASDDSIITEPGIYILNITGDSSSYIILNNDILNASANISNTNVYWGRENIFDTSNLYLESGLVSLINNKIGIASPASLTITGNTNLHLDVDLATSTMDRLTSASYGPHTGTLTVTGINLLSDSTSDHTEILFAEPGLKDHVVNGISNAPTSSQSTAYTPIYKYNVNYSNQDDGGYFHFDRASSSSNPSDSFNPSVLSTPVASQAGAQSVVNETVHFAFQHMDMFSQLPFAQRIAIINNNKYAINDPTLTPKYNPEFEMINKGFWTKPFTSFERINLHYGPDVDAITYGTLVGFDSNFRELKRGWYNVQSIYGGYNGSQLSYSGVDSTLNGGIAGITETFYKNNFFTAVTATAGASVGTNNTMYGNEDFTVLLGGIGAKGGYNFEFKDGKYILQPIMFANYSFVNTFDYTNAAGVRMKSDPLHTFQINPQLKFVANLSNGWQPYASVGLVWNVLNSSKVKADDVILPKMTVDPYVEYGLGLQRNWKERFTGFAQAMVRNGGRNGVALTFGFRWAIGKCSEDL